MRESLERQTLDMARSVAKMLGSRLRHSNGLPVEEPEPDEQPEEEARGDP